ncbi:ABC transporter ATP-binding protein [Arthrobacter sp. AL12]|uniref:ABC transporter transmembrane domain-containing protein n=1 Tax=Arthrobacter sp. AL12 TaxID=3042241 RepID=UPI00249AA063|nr:ABC transporter ATP-binding protein [Arthrobacter sp. AL12]MDI3211316.1 ABC transporter ATP-binding protein [Arthrobacter sp. AL12]
MTRRQESIAALPKLMVGRRRKLMALLAGTGLAMAALSAASAHSVAFLLNAADNQARFAAIAGMLVMAGGIGTGRIIERVLAERLGQSYIQELRRGLMTAALATPKGPSVGITIARLTNDLSSVRNWVSMGIAPLTAGIPLIVGTTIALWFLSPPLALAMALPLCVLGVALALLARPAFNKAKALRRKRGRLAAQVAETLAAAVPVRAAGGESREVQRIYRLGGEVAAAAIDRARVGSYIRAAATVSGAVTVILVAATGSWLSINGGTIAAALALVGLLASPVNDFGRVAEYRQTFNAAKRMIGPAIASGSVDPARPELKEPKADDPYAAPSDGEPEDPTDFLVRISGLHLDGKRPVPDLLAKPGDRIILKTSDPGETTDFFEMLLALREESGLNTWVAGRELRSVPGSERRRLAGYAARGALTERGTIGRAVRYRRPDLPVGETEAALARVELGDRVAGLPRRERTILQRGGEPLSASDRAKLQLARATLGNPPLLLLNHIDFDLGAEGRRILARVLDSYPGVAIIASDDPEHLVPKYSVWDLR